MAELEPFDWTPERKLLEAVSPRVGAVVEYVQSARRRNGGRALVTIDRAAAEAGIEAHDLRRRVTNDEELLALFSQVMEAAQRHADADRLLLLSRVFVGAVSDTALVDEAQIITSIVRDLEPVHVRVLALLVAALDQPPTVAETPSQAAGEVAEGVVRTTAHVIVVRELGCSHEAAQAVLGRLVALGLAWVDPPGFGGAGLTGLGLQIADMLRS